MGVKAVVLVVVAAVLGVCASPAWGAFPGRDGDLVVATGTGLELVAPGTGAASSICAEVVLCGHPARPAFSQNGRAITFVDTASGRPVVVAADGSCLWCLLGAPLTGRTGSEPAFTPGGQGLTVVGNGVWSVSLTGGRARRLFKGRVDGAVWSSRGLVAVVRGGWIWVGRPGHGTLRRLARGRFPSFSPGGARLAFARGGYVWIARVADGGERRLVRGGAPAWSPDGLRIAYIAPSGAVEIVAVRGGRSRRVGSVSGTALDWQPLPGVERHTCRRPRGSTVLTSNREAVVFLQGGERIYGCLKALGVTRLLLNMNTQSAFGGTLTAVRLAGRFVALDSAYFNQYVGDWEYATLYDLSSGKATQLARVGQPQGSASPSNPGDGLDSLVLDSSGFAAWRRTTRPIPKLGLTAMSCPSASLCVAGDVAGNILTSSDPTGGPDAWSVAVADPGQGIRGVSCPSALMCVAADSAGNILVSTDPTGGESAWTKTKIETGTYPDEPNAVSCPSVSLCVAVDENGNIFTSTDPTGGGSAWSKAKLEPGARLWAVSCPSASLCVANDDGGNILSSTDPTGGAGAWKKTNLHGPFALFFPVSCPSVSLCVAGDGVGRILTSTDPTGGANAWRKANLEPSGYLAAVSCPSVSLCVAGDGTGNILSSTDPTGGNGAWTIAPADQAGPPFQSVNTVSCPSVSLCVAGDNNGNILTSTDPTGGANAWSSAAVDGPGCPPCRISERLLVRDDHGTKVVDTAPPGQGNSISSVTLDGDSLALSWTHNGAQRQLQLH